MATSVMGIEIGSSNIKIVETVKKGVTQVVRKFSLLPTPEDCIRNGVINNVEPLRKVIATELKERKYKAKKVVCVVQSSNTIIRSAEMEKQPEKVISQLLEIKTEDFLPIEKGQYQIDFKITGEVESEEGVKNKLLLVAAPNNVVLPMAGLIKSLRLVPISITIPSESIENIFYSKSRMIYDNSGNVMVLDIGAKSTTATIIADDKACLTRMIEYGVDNLSENVKASAVNLNKDGQSDEEYFMSVFRPQIEYNIVSEVERILQFYYSSYGYGIIKKIYLTGGGASIKGIRGYMRDALNIPTEKLSHFDTVVEAPGVEFESHARFFANVLGAINGV